MSQQQRQSKVLRIGVIQDGKLVQERLAKAGESVTVGANAKCTFVFPDLPHAEFTLFEWRDEQYHLKFDTELKGKVSSGGAMFALEKAQNDPTVAFADGIWTLPLTEQDRGKVKLGSVTVLFQFVPPPPVQAAAPLESMDFRPRLLDDDDPVFVGFLAIWSAAAIVFTVWVYNADPVEIAMEDIPDRFTKIKMYEPAEEPPPVEIEEDMPESEDGQVKREAEEADKTKTKAKAETEVDRAREQQDKKDQIMQQSYLLQQLQARMIGTTGANAAGTVLLENADGTFDDVSGRLQQAAENGAAIGDGSAIRGGAGVVGATGDRNIGDISQGIDNGSTDLGTAPKLTLNPTVSTDDVDFGGNASDLNKVIRKYRGQMKYCYEQSLKKNPSLAGRVVIGWEIASEVAEDIYIAENSTGDSEFAECLKAKIKRWQFLEIDDGPAKQTFIFQPQE
jgi:hypothetical protein